MCYGGSWARTRHTTHAPSIPGKMRMETVLRAFTQSSQSHSSMRSLGASTPRTRRGSRKGDWHRSVFSVSSSLYPPCQTSFLNDRAGKLNKDPGGHHGAAIQQEVASGWLVARGSRGSAAAA